MFVHQIYYARGNAHCFALPLVPGFCRAEDQHSGLTVKQSADWLCRDIPHFCHLKNRVMPLGGNCAAHGLRGLLFQRMHGFPCQFTRIHQFVYLCSRPSVPSSFMLFRNKDRGFDCLARPKASGCPAGQFAPRRARDKSMAFSFDPCRDVCHQTTVQRHKRREWQCSTTSGD